MKNMKKQISIVLESDEGFDELELLTELKKFMKNFSEVKIVGTHTKVLKPFIKRENEKNL
jgi:hypothetical protein